MLFARSHFQTAVKTSNQQSLTRIHKHKRASGQHLVRIVFVARPRNPFCPNPPSRKLTTILAYHLEHAMLASQNSPALMCKSHLLCGSIGTIRSISSICTIRSIDGASRNVACAISTIHHDTANVQALELVWPACFVEQTTFKTTKHNMKAYNISASPACHNPQPEDGRKLKTFQSVKPYSRPAGP